MNYIRVAEPTTTRSLGEFRSFVFHVYVRPRRDGENRKRPKSPGGRRERSKTRCPRHRDRVIIVVYIYIYIHATTASEGCRARCDPSVRNHGNVGWCKNVVKDGRWLGRLGWRRDDTNTFPSARDRFSNANAAPSSTLNHIRFAVTSRREVRAIYPPDTQYAWYTYYGYDNIIIIIIIIINRSRAEHRPFCINYTRSRVHGEVVSRHDNNIIINLYTSCYRGGDVYVTKRGDNNRLRALGVNIFFRLHVLYRTTNDLWSSPVRGRRGERRRRLRERALSLGPLEVKLPLPPPRPTLAWSRPRDCNNTYATTTW